MEFIIKLLIETEITEGEIKSDIKYLIQDYLRNNNIRVLEATIANEVLIRAEDIFKK